nr:hypothetical protein [uncultured Cupriavidus sp.]
MSAAYQNLLNALLMLSLAAISAASHAQPAVKRDDTTPAAQSETIPYVSGGVGVDDVARMRELAPLFNVRLRFQDKATGASLSDVKVIILNENKVRLLRVITEGPLLYFKVRPGRYYLAAVYADEVHESTLVIAQKVRTMTISFRVNEMEGTWKYCLEREGRCHRREQE